MFHSLPLGLREETEIPFAGCRLKAAGVALRISGPSVMIQGGQKP
jgi:hypothetical protein